MSIKERAHHDEPYLKGTSWEINGEYVLLEKQAHGETLLSATHLRRREWAERVRTLIEEVARARGVFLRIEGGIDVEHVVIASGGAEAVREELGRRRLEATDYESLTIDVAKDAVLAQVDAKGGSADWTEIDDDLVSDRFPLGYRARNAIEDLERSGAIRIIRAKGAATLQLTDLGRARLRQ